jgi:hypothetical protein
MVVSVVVGLRNMSISRLDGFRIMRSRKLIHPLHVYALVILPSLKFQYDKYLLL